ncbi:uncharacterized protein LACBIDRAFT_394934 [Laccaria bicolor S238N-H82]|uniref:Predicted protein n=1 Tax=Laccaria bicolor (strain S238N-H82 / ATCC MYA-4686) TaxID=486041 RepID=B0DV59_LACBS|nr:uncharacterized protein LACBIDRAFT_394934 [Laccaria bicolor S238N-H82]EDR01454.1 predicted protein [Laccaria bicolor S238N-H82]|eukprot:XP_001887806.1 predicted protein [Laccaria bicolor S238N-H82]
MERSRIVSRLGLLAVVGFWLFSLVLSTYPLFYHDRSFAREKSFSISRKLAGQRTRFCDLLSEDDKLQRGGWWWTLTQMVMAQQDSEICTDGGPANPSWEGLKGGEHCLRYATREYTAKLVNTPSGADALKTCRETPVGIHEAALFPDFCQDLGSWGGVWGHWVIDFAESDCRTWWGDFEDRGCVDHGSTMDTRRFESRLENLREGDDWQIMCATTPADFEKSNFPLACTNSGKPGVYGIWEFEDKTCYDILPS